MGTYHQHEDQAALKEAQRSMDGARPLQFLGTRALFAFVSATFFGMAYVQLRGGILRSRWGSPMGTRQDSPIAFWFFVTAELALALYTLRCVFKRY